MEQFVHKLRNTSVRPACCFQKLESFKVLNEMRTQATVYAKVGLEGTPNAAESCTREFKLTHEEIPGRCNWRMYWTCQAPRPRNPDTSQIKNTILTNEY
jgi:hypothetical protein